MIGVNVSIYEAESPEKQRELMGLTIDELANPKFPAQINVLICQKEDRLIVMVIQPTTVSWTWPPSKWGGFAKPEQTYIARL
jgi:hypothetical protein